MAAQVELQTTEVGRTGVGGRLHLSPLTDSSNKSPIEGPSNSQGPLIITLEPSKPAPGPKPRLTPKPFAVEKNPTIRPILAPKPQTKPRPESTRPTSYNPDPPSVSKPQQQNVTSKPRPVSTNPGRPASTSFKPSPKLTSGQTTKPVIQPFKPAPSLTFGDPGKPSYPLEGLNKLVPTGLSSSKSLKKSTAAEWFGSTQQRETPCPQTARTSMTRAKSMGFLNQIGKEEEDEDKGPVSAVSLRPHSRGSRPRPVSAIFLPSPSQNESQSSFSRWEGRRPLSADLTSKFESIGLSLHRKPAMADSKENTPEDGAPLRRKERESEGTVPGQDSKARLVMSESEIKRDANEDANKEERSGGSIKRRISLLFDSSLSCPVEGVSVQGSEPRSPVKSLPEAAALLGVKQRIKKLTADTPPALSPSVKTILKPRPLPLDLTKRFTSERSTDLISPSFNEVTERHEVDRDPQRGWEGSGASPRDQTAMDEDGSCTSKPFSQSSQNLLAGRTETRDVVERVSEQSSPSLGEQKVRAALFENVVERHSVQVFEDGQTKDKAMPRRSFSLRRRDVENEGSLVTATYHQPVSPTSPLRVEHSFDTVPTISESRVQSVSVPAAQLEDKAMTLRSRRSESRPGWEGSSAAVQGDQSLALTPELQPRFLRVGALQKWSTTGLEKEAETERGKQKDLETERQMAKERERRVDERERQREAERKVQLDLDMEKKGEEVAAPKRLKMLEADDQPPKPRATYFALTGQIQDTVSTVDEGADRGDMEIPVEELSIRSGRWASQGKVFSSRRNPSLDEALSKSLENQEPAEVLQRRSQASEKELGLVRDKNIAIEEMEIEKQRELEKKRQREKRREIEKEKQGLLEIERRKRLEFARMRELEEQRGLERERQKEFEKEQQRELERERKLEIERRRQQELEKERIKELEMKRQQALERERIKELENARQQEMERQRQQELERERQRQLENQRLQDLEKERQRQLETERQRLLEREKQLELDKERQQLETQRERQRFEELERIKDMERRQLLEFEKKKQIEQEKQQQLALEEQKLREQLERKEAEKIRQMAIQQEVDRQRQIEKEREKQRELEQERLKALERERQMELAKQRQRAVERQKQLDYERQELERQKLRQQQQQQQQQQQEKERQRIEELERIKEMERRQLLEFEKQKQAEWERQQQLLEKQSLRDKMEKDEAERMRQIARQQESERQRIKEKQRKEEQEHALDSSPLRPKVLDLDSVSRDDQFARGTPHFSDPSSRWKQPSPRSEDPYKPAILDIDSFRSQTQKPVSKETFPVAAIQNVDFHTPERNDGPRMIAEGAVRQQSPLWAPSQQMLWEPRLVETTGNRPIAAPEPPRKPVKMPSIEQLLIRQEGRVLAPERTWSGPPSEPPQHTALARRETIASTPNRSRNAPGEQTWFPREPEPQGQSRVQARGHRRSHGGQDLNRMRSRSVSRRSAPAESVLEGSLARMRSRSAHRDRDLQSWEQQTQNVSLEEQVKESDTLVHDTDSQYGTWETGLRTDDSLTPATPTSDSKPTPPPTPGDHTPSSDLDTPDGFPPLRSSESQALSFPETSTTLLDSSALRSRVQLGKQRAPRSRPSRAARQTAALSSLPEGPADAAEDSRYRDSTEAKLETKQEDSDSEEQVKGGQDPRPTASAQPQRVPIFPGMDPSALKAQLKKRGDSDNQSDGLAPSATQLSRSPKSPFLPRASRVLPPAGGKENGEEDSPKWLRELKSKKRLSQYENDS